MKLKMQKSEQLMNLSRSLMPGGVSSPVRSFQAVGGQAFVARQGKGPYLYDVDGNKFIDLVCSWGPLIHGHNHPRIVESIVDALKDGVSFGVTSEPEIKLCQRVIEMIPGLEMLRLVNSGTEACMSAIRLARAYTNRNLILKFEGNYHGHADSFLISAGSGLATLGVAGSAGISKDIVHSTLVSGFNDIESLEKLFSEHGERIAGVIVEPVAGNMGVVRPSMEFLSSLRNLTEKYEALLIFDEVMTGFRLSSSGAQGIYNIEPDLSCFGKVIGGGLPVGAYGGKTKLMSLVAPLGPMYQAGTLSGNPLAAAAGLASLELILDDKRNFYQLLDASGAHWKSYLEAHIKHKSYPVCVEQIGSMLTIFFCEKPPRNYDEAKVCNLDRFKSFFWALLERGVYYPPSQFESCFLSSAHTEEIMERVAEASVGALDAAFEVAK